MLTKIKSPVLVLFFLSPFIAEFLTGATPPLGLLNPLLVLFFGAFYGSSAIIIRELTLRWQKGLPTQLVLGLAFAILEEGIVTKVFFNPGRGDLSPLVNYGSYLGIHWGFVLFLMLFHSVSSINIPILLTNLMFPEKRNQPWTGSLTKFWVILITATFLGLLIPDFRYAPNPLSYLFFIILMVGLFLLAKRLPQNFFWSKSPKTTSFIKLFLWGFFFNSLLFLSWFAPGLKLPPFLVWVYLIIVSVIAYKKLLQVTNNGSIPNSLQFALASGVLSLFILIDFFRPIMIPLALAMIGILFITWKKVKSSS